MTLMTRVVQVGLSKIDCLLPTASIAVGIARENISRIVRIAEKK